MARVPTPGSLRAKIASTIKYLELPAMCFVKAVYCRQNSGRDDWSELPELETNEKYGPRDQVGESLLAMFR